MPSKSELKKYLHNLSKEQIIEIIINAYQNNKPIKDYFDYFLYPDEEERMKQCRKMIDKKFNFKKNKVSTLHFYDATKTINEFASLNPNPKNLADLMVYLIECACKYTFEPDFINVHFYITIVNYFKETLEFLKNNNLLAEFQQRCLNCVNLTEQYGYGFYDDMIRVYCEYYPNDYKIKI